MNRAYKKWLVPENVYWVAVLEGRDLKPYVGPAKFTKTFMETDDETGKSRTIYEFSLPMMVKGLTVRLIKEGMNVAWFMKDEFKVYKIQ